VEKFSPRELVVEESLSSPDEGEGGRTTRGIRANLELEEDEGL
jgi:hypothetical protein